MNRERSHVASGHHATRFSWSTSIFFTSQQQVHLLCHPNTRMIENAGGLQISAFPILQPLARGKIIFWTRLIMMRSPSWSYSQNGWTARWWTLHMDCWEWAQGSAESTSWPGRHEPWWAAKDSETLLLLANWNMHDGPEVVKMVPGNDDVNSNKSDEGGQTLN